MLRMIFAVLLGLGCTAAWAQEKFKTRGLSVVQQEETDLRAALLERLQSEDRRTSLIASAELRGGYSDDPEVIARLLDILDQRVLGAEPGDRLAPSSRKAIYDVLVSMEPSAWDKESLQRADRLVAAIDYRLESEVSDDEFRAIQHLYATLEDIGGVDLAYGEIQGLVEGKTQFTDVDVFVCSYASDDPDVAFLALDFAHGLAANDFGRVRLRASTVELEKSLEPLPGKTSVFVDYGHPEEKEFARLGPFISDYDLPPPVERANKGEPSLWYLSVFVCP